MLRIRLGQLPADRPRTHEVVAAAVARDAGSGSRREVAALVTLLGGFGAAVTLALLAAGQQKLVYTIGIGAAITGGIVGAVKILGQER